MLSPERIARFFRMDDEAWRRHANPWSVYTRLAAVPAMILAVWSRAWIGWWALAPVVVVLVWLWINPRAFAAVDPNRGWASRGIYGEKWWLENRRNAPEDFQTLLRWLIGLGLIGLATLVWGLVALRAWPTVYGATLLIVAQLWRIDRMGLLYKESRRAASPKPTAPESTETVTAPSAVPAEIWDAVRGDDDAAFEALCNNEDCCFSVDWREEDEYIPRYCESVLRTGRLTSEWVGDDDLFVIFGAKRARVPLTESAADRHITLLALNEALAPEFEVRMLYAAVGDTLVFAPLSTDGWRALEREAAEVVSRRFHKLSAHPNIFTELVKFPTKPKSRPWWRFWARG